MTLARPTMAAPGESTPPVGAFRAPMIRPRPAGAAARGARGRPPAGGGVPRADDPPEAGGAGGAVGRGRRGGGPARPVARRLGPAGITHLVEEDQDDPAGGRGRLAPGLVEVVASLEGVGVGAVV